MFAVSHDGGQTWQTPAPAAAGYRAPGHLDPGSRRTDIGLASSPWAWVPRPVPPHDRARRGHLCLRLRRRRLRGPPLRPTAAEVSTVPTTTPANGASPSDGIRRHSRCTACPTNRSGPMSSGPSPPTRPGRGPSMPPRRPGPRSLGNIIDSADIDFARSTDYGADLADDLQGRPEHGDRPERRQRRPARHRQPGRRDQRPGPAPAAVDAQGNIAVIWYDTRRDPADQRLDVFGTVSTDGGQTFSPNFRITDQSFDPDAGKFTDADGQTDYYLGDFLGLAVANDTAYAAWTDTRNGNQDVVLHPLPDHPGPRAAQRPVRAQRHRATATDLGTVTQRPAAQAGPPRRGRGLVPGPGRRDRQPDRHGDAVRPAARPATSSSGTRAGRRLAGERLDRGGPGTASRLVFPGQSGRDLPRPRRMARPGGHGVGRGSRSIRSTSAR